MNLLSFMASGELLFISFITVFIVLLPLLALISVVKNKFEGNDKIVWLLIILFLPFLGSILYFFIGRNKRIIH